MRARATNGDLSVNAVAGPYVVLLGINLPESEKNRLLGFAIERTDHTENERYWLRGTRTFEATQPAGVRPGLSVSTREHPIQAFLWGDYTAKPKHSYTYRVVALEGQPKRLEEFGEVACDVRTPGPSGGRHGIFFNRGVAGSQAWVAKFGNQVPDEVPDRAGYKWLSRGLIEAFERFVNDAKPGDGLRAALYECSYDPAIAAFASARDRGVDVRIVFDAKQTGRGPREANLAAIERAGLGDIAIARESNPHDIAHNKFVVLLRGGEPWAVWTGSTNLTEGGIYGHSNLGHVVRDRGVAARFIAYWDELSRDPPRPSLREWSETHPLPSGPPPKGISVEFSPRRSAAALEWYASLMDQAQQGVFFTAAFGVSEPLRNVLARERAYLRYGLLERADGRIEVLKRDRNNVFAIGSHIRSDLLGRWAAERLTGFNRHVKYVHTKFMLIDPLTADPIIVTGSANFSTASARENDENMLIIRGDTGVADVYLGEFMRLFNHFQFRGLATADIAAGRQLAPMPSAGESEAAATGEPRSGWTWHLSPRADWAWAYYRPGWRRTLERELFA